MIQFGFKDGRDKNGVRKRILFPFFLLSLLLILPSCSQPGEYVTVSRVVDGDTFETAQGEKVRLIGVDTPETVKPGSPVEPYGKEASNFTKQHLTGKKVRMEYDVEAKDRYGRTLAYVYLEDGTFYNELLLLEGYAQVLTIPPNVKYADRFLAAQRKAREAGKGLWGGETPGEADSSADANTPKEGSSVQERPPSPENGEKADLDKRYVDEKGNGLIKGNINADGKKIYHMPGGAFYDQTKPEAWFKTEREAQEAGFRKSKR